LYTWLSYLYTRSFSPRTFTRTNRRGRRGGRGRSNHGNNFGRFNGLPNANGNTVIVIINRFGGEIKHIIDGCLEFLGMKFQIKDKGVVITMPAKIDDVAEGIDKTSQTPAGSNLFTINEYSPLLTDLDKSQFHTLTAKLLSKRARPDILLVVNFITTRVQNPTDDDQSKLTRVLKYLKGT